jgi:hypothetical protein
MASQYGSRDASLANVLLMDPIRTRFLSTLATYNMLSRIHITLWFAPQPSRWPIRLGRSRVVAEIV